MLLEDLHGLLVHELKDLYNAENQILDALPEVIAAATDPELRRVLEAHREETVQQVELLEQAFRLLGEDPIGHTCRGMEGLLRELRSFLGGDADDVVLDAGLLAAVQRIEHYEIACYGTAIAYARLLGEDEVMAIAQEILDQEKAADLALTDVAETTVNRRALA